jgi:hypothetical protein
MRGIWAGSLGLSLGMALASAPAQEASRRPASSRPVITMQAPMANPPPAVALGRPVPLSAATDSESLRSTPSAGSVRPVAYLEAPPTTPQPIIRGQSPDPRGPTLVPPAGAGVPIAPIAPAERYNCGMVSQSPAPGNSFLEAPRRWLGSIPGVGGCDGKHCFESDHAFDGFISPVSNPFLFEDPRSLTEVRPIFLFQSTPHRNWIFQGGDVEFFGLQARVALCDRFSIVMNKLGLIWMEPHNHEAGFNDHVGISEINIGPKYTFLRNDSTRTLGAVGLNFEIPAGPKKVFQETGDLTLAPYLSMAQNFGRTSYGSFNAMGTLGYNFRTDNQRTESFYTSLHLDFDIVEAHRYYPLIELNYFHYTRSGQATALDFEGRDLFNFGSRGVAGMNEVSMAVGFRYKYTEHLQTGLAAEFPLTGGKDLLDFRLTLDFIFRY